MGQPPFGFPIQLSKNMVKCAWAPATSRVEDDHLVRQKLC